MGNEVEPVSYRKVTVLDYISAGFTYFAIFFVRFLPFTLASNLGAFLASTFGPMFKKSQMARKNIAAAFPEKTEAEIEMILREVWETLGRAAFEFPIMDRLITGKDRSRIEIEGEEHLRAAEATGKPILFFGAHLGSWELIAMSSRLMDIQSNIFYRAPNNPLLLKLFTTRPINGEMIPKGAPGAKRAFTLLKRGENLGIMIDQKLNDGIPIPLFGRDAMTGTVLAKFAKKFDAPMVPVRCVRLPGARFRLSFSPALEVKESDDETSIMTTVNEMLESWIREDPGQWLWLHKRWPD